MRYALYSLVLNHLLFQSVVTPKRKPYGLIFCPVSVTSRFFFGIIFAVGGLGVLGYLGLASEYLYTGMGPTPANIIIGVLSAIVDNIPLMFAVLTMNPTMSEGQWLLITLTCGTGGSILSIGSAAGVALMGQARGIYTFMAHLKWAWVVALGYGVSIVVHMWLNAALF